MPFVTIVAGLALIIIGVGFYFGTGSKHLTALIPAAPGVLMVLGGAFALKPNLRKHLIHAALVLALLTIIAVSYRLISTLKPAEAAQLLSILVCVAYIATGIQSFVSARRKQQDRGAASKTASPESI